MIVPPDRDAQEIMQLIIAKAESLKLTISRQKSRIVPLSKPFKYCKAKYQLTETGKVVVNGNRDSMKRARRKIRAFNGWLGTDKMTYEDLWASSNGLIAYFKKYDDHNRVLKLRRLFYSIYGFSSEHISEFRQRDKKEESKGAVHSTQTI